MKKKVLELFAGSRSMGKAAEELGMEVFSSDIEPFEKIDYVVDILEFDLARVPFIPDIIHGSVPCQGFSVAAMGKNWVKGEPFTPKTDSAKLGIKLALKTLAIIDHFKALNPDLIFFIENPRGKLRKAPFMRKLCPNYTITYCQYGDDRMKPTNIWTNLPLFKWTPRPVCRNGDKCHISAPRGSQTGTQGLKGDYLRSMMPHELCIELLKACL